MVENGIRRGTTPYITYTVTDDMDFSNIQTVWLSIAQNGVIIIDKKTEDFTRVGKTFSLRLSQEETLSLKAGISAYIQMRFYTQTELAYATDEEYIPVYPIIKEGVIQ